MKIIILDDDVFFGNLVKNFLINQDYHSVQLFHKEEDCLNNIGSLPTLVILDHHLAKSTGLDVMVELKQRNPLTKVIYLSGQEYMHIAIKALRGGAIDYIEKNRNSFFQLKLLIDKILIEDQNSTSFYSEAAS